MDYDGNDINCHNIQLVGEGRTKSSSGLRPYDFPKFDFGESLQGHLRFDSLVETEVFLGIQSQEDSQWIEDFARDTNGMEFNSTPADSCSISRRNNVWSEATSSESVEMLLKSVGQEEMMPDESIVLESNAGDDQGTLTKCVEPASKKDENIDGYAAILKVTVLEDRFFKDDPASKTHVEEQLPETEVPSATHVCRKDGTSTNDGINSYQDDHLRESKTSAEKSMNSGPEECSVHVADSINCNSGDLSTFKAPEQVDADVLHVNSNVEGQEKHVASSTGQEDSKSSEGKIVETSRDTHSVCSLSSAAGLGGVNNQDSVEARVGRVGETTERESEMKSSGRDGRDCSSVNGLDQHSAELGSLGTGDFAGAKQNVDPYVQLTSTPDANPIEDTEASTVESDSITRMPVFSSDDKKVPVENCINETNDSKPSDMPLLSSAAGNKQAESVEGCHKDSIVARQGPGVLLPVATESYSKQVIEENLAHRQLDFSELEQDICKIKKKDEKLPTDTENSNSRDVVSVTTYETTQSLDLSKGVTVDVNVCKVQHQTVGKMGLESDVAPHATSRTTSVVEDEIGQGEPAVAGSSYPDNACGEAATRIENFSAETGNVTKVKDSITDDAARSPLSEIAAKAPQPLDKSNDINVGKSPSMEDTNSMYSNHSQVDIGCDMSSLKESVNADLISRENQGVTMMKLEGEKESEQAAEADKTSCGSPTIISSSEPSQMDKYEEETRGSVTTDKLVNQSTPELAKPKDALGDDTSFTFKVNALPDTTEREPGRSWLPFPDVEKSKLSVVVDEASPSVKCKAAKTPSKKTPRQSTRVFDGEPVRGTPKGTSERKGRRASPKGPSKDNAKKGNREMDANQQNALVKGDKVLNTLLSTSNSSPAQFGMTQPYGLIEQSNAKLSGAVAAPHLSTSNTSSSASFRQPFTDLQQVQLRAQIFVYGSLIQGIAPDEACMVSAFGPSDGGRSIWEPVWRTAVERVRSHNSNSAAAETPLHSQSGVRTSDAAVKQSSHSSKVLSSSVGRSNSKGTLPASPIIPLSSPLWSVSTPSRDSMPSSVSHKGPSLDYSHTVTPLHPYQTPPVKNFVGQTSWPQACFPGPWLASPQTTTFNSSICFQPITMAETVKLTPAKGTSVPVTSEVKHATPSPVAHAVGASPVHEGATLQPDSKPISSVERHFVDSKPKKRKKVPGSDLAQVSLLSEARSEAVVVSNAAANLFSRVAIPAPASPAPDILTKAAGDASTVCPIDSPKQSIMDTGKAITCSEETMSKVAEAKNQAEDAAALAAAAVSHSENLWGQLAKQKESGLTSEAEVKLASSSIAISAAASVAKAAAAAARVAYSAALQAKQMADEAFLSCKTSASGRSSMGMHDIASASPVSILKGDKITNQSNSILFAAKEAAKRRVEAASAASKQAENLDAIVKAAELAAAAVSQAGKIVAMGEPLPLSDLIEAGPEGYWKLPQHSSDFAEKVTDNNKEQARTCNLEEDAVLSAKVSGEGSVERGGSETLGHGKSCPREKSNDPLDGHGCRVDGTMGSVHSGDREFTSSRGCEGSEKFSIVASQPGTIPSTGSAQVKHDELADSVPEDSINEGSLVEVFKHGDGLKSAWYSANILRLEDGKAYVCYSDLLSEEGSGNLCEWITLEGVGGNSPVIRAAHPSTTLPLQATRKRRRAALGDYAWSVGDRVDVWIDDCWWEGVVTEKDEKDETTLKVHFAAQGETSTVRAWNLRTSRTWTNGKWVEWSSSGGSNASEQSDTPHEKRQKLGTATAPTKGEDKLANDLDSGSVKPNESKLLPLSTTETTFNIGKVTREDKKQAAQRSLRSGQQKEGSKVIFGVPKPTGKKRKFMEVSKHFPANRNDKSNETNNSVKFAKYLMPQATASRGWKAPSRNDSKEKRAAESRSRAPISRKPTRTLPRRDNRIPALGKVNDNPIDDGNDIEDSAVRDENESEKLAEPGSSACEEAPEAPLSSLLPNTLNATSKKISSSNSKSERINKGKIVPSRGKLSSVVEEKSHDGNAGNSETTQPRRSNRRIQPTHRLLEGLQSSMVIPKMTSVSHDRGLRNPSRNVSAKGR